jgi:hypothetical protein
MTTVDTALPVGGQPAQEASGQPNADQLEQDHQDLNESSQQEGQGDQIESEADKTKPEKTPEERERQRMQRGIDRRTKQLAEERARREHLEHQLADLTQRTNRGNNDASGSDSEPLTLTRQQLQEMVKAEASKLAPTLKEQNAEIERRQGVVQSLAKTWGQERFDELSSDLDDAFGGLTDSSGRPKPAMEAVFESDEPAKVIEYLADPENAEEADRIARMSAIQAGKAIARLEDKLKADAAKAKPQPSRQPPPLESVRGQGGAPGAPDPSDTKAWIRYRNEQERKGLA